MAKTIAPDADPVGDRPVTPARSRLMARVRGSDTTPELSVRRLLHSLGFRFRLHRRDLPGTPDIVLPRHRLAIFVHGCFWHRHAGCRRTTTPKTRVRFWQDKFDANVERDRRTIERLEAAGWRCAVIWECETKDPDRLRERLISLLSSGTEQDSPADGSRNEGGKRLAGS